MIDRDYEPFVAEFTRISHALDPYKKTPETIRAKADAYFHALKTIPFSEVCAKADAWIQRESKFPKPVEWAAQVVPAAPRDLRTMTDAEAREYRRAETLGYEDSPCACPDCLHAGVSERPSRFVPNVDHHDRPALVMDPRLNRVVTEGHWAHGRELAGWYEARATFWNRCFELGLIEKLERPVVERKPLAERLEAIFRKRSA